MYRMASQMSDRNNTNTRREGGEIIKKHIIRKKYWECWQNNHKLTISRRTWRGISFWFHTRAERTGHPPQSLLLVVFNLWNIKIWLFSYMFLFVNKYISLDRNEFMGGHHIADTVNVHTQHVWYMRTYQTMWWWSSFHLVFIPHPNSCFHLGPRRRETCAAATGFLRWNSGFFVSLLSACCLGRYLFHASETTIKTYIQSILEAINQPEKKKKCQ